jgi:hypothetical protein
MLIGLTPFGVPRHPEGLLKDPSVHNAVQCQKLVETVPAYIREQPKCRLGWKMITVPPRLQPEKEKNGWTQVPPPI